MKEFDRILDLMTDRQANPSNLQEGSPASMSRVRHAPHPSNIMFGRPRSIMRQEAKLDVSDIFTRPNQEWALGVSGIQTAAASQTWLGGPIDLVDRHADRSSWANMAASIAAAGADNALATQQLVWSIPIILQSGIVNADQTTQANLREAEHATWRVAAANGEYNANYKAIAQAILAAHNRDDGPIVTRFGWEMNALWQPWRAIDTLTGNQFKTYFPLAVNQFRSVSSRFKFCWCPNLGGYDPELSYPGDEYVDMIGIDIYYDAKDNTGDGPGFLNYAKTLTPGGLNYIAAKAVSTKKPLCVPEWGVKASGYDNVGPGHIAVEAVNVSGNQTAKDQVLYVSQFHDWMRQNKVKWHNLWDSNNDIDCEFKSGQYPITGAGFKALFGAPVISTPAALNWYLGEAMSIPLVGSHSGTWAIAGGANANLFSIVGNNLVASAQPAGSYVVNIRLTDSRGLIANRTVTVTVIAVPVISTAGNLLTLPSTISDASWSKSGVTVTADNVVGLDPAVNNGNTVIETATSGFHRFLKTYTTTTGVKYRLHAVLVEKTPSARYFNPAIAQGRMTFDLQTKSFVSSGNTAGHPTVSNPTVTYMGAGRWYFTGDFTEVAGASREIKFDFNHTLVAGNDSPFYTGDGTAGFGISGFWITAAP